MEKLPTSSEKLPTSSETGNISLDIMKSIAKVKDRTFNLVKGGFQNRIAFISYILTTIGLWHIELAESFPYMLFIALTPSIACLIMTEGGIATAKMYNRTKQNLEKYGKIKEAYILISMQGEEHYRWIGYCQLQGIYLAMKEFGMEDEFFKMKEKLTNNKIPNF